MLSQFIHLFSVRCQILDTHTHAYSQLPAEDAAWSSKEFKEGTLIFTHTHTHQSSWFNTWHTSPPTQASIPPCRWTSSLIELYCSRTYPVNQGFLTQDTNNQTEAGNTPICSSCLLPVFPKGSRLVTIYGQNFHLSCSSDLPSLKLPVELHGRDVTET